MSFPRPLTETEKAVTLRVLELGEVAEMPILRSQVEAAIAASPCPCPCPSLALDVDRERATPTSYSGRPVAEAYYDGGAVMVWVDDGWLSNLEIHWWSDETPAQFPPLDSLTKQPPQFD
jgi:hypothetical protein